MRAPRASRFRLTSTILAIAALSSACTAAATTEPITTAEPVPLAPVELTTEFLVQAAARTIGASSYRYEGFFEDGSFGPVFGSRTRPHLVGEVAGNLSRAGIDRTDFIGGELRSLAPSQQDLTITIVTEDENAFVTSPYFKLLINTAGFDGASYAWVDEIASAWGRVDLGVVRFGDIGGLLDSGTGPRGTDVLELLEQGRHVLDGGAGEVRGVPTRIFHTDVTFRIAMEHLGLGTVEASLSEAAIDLLDDAHVNVEVHIDDDGLVRRIEYATNDGILGHFRDMWLRVDYFDFDGEIEVATPAAWVDITAEMLDFTADIG